MPQIIENNEMKRKFFIFMSYYFNPYKISNYNETTLMLSLKIPDKNVKSVFA